MCDPKLCRCGHPDVVLRSDTERYIVDRIGPLYRDGGGPVEYKMREPGADWARLGFVGGLPGFDTLKVGDEILLTTWYSGCIAMKREWERPPSNIEED